MQLQEQICLVLDLEPGTVLKKPIRNLPGFTTLQLVEALINSDTVNDAAMYLGYAAASSIKPVVSKVLGDLYPDRGHEFSSGGHLASWRFTLLKEIEHKFCSSCKTTKSYSEFTKDSSTSDGLESYCKSCRVFNAIERKKHIKTRTTPWSQKDKIKEFYDNCPLGFHVDHIIPLQGRTVSGLHVLENLQYLPELENLNKGNKYECG